MYKNNTNNSGINNNCDCDKKKACNNDNDKNDDAKRYIIR